MTTATEVRRPRPVLGRERERRLTERQRELLDELEQLFEGGFADLTMAELAARLNCSMRTLYALAPSRDELVLIVVDRNLWRVGRAAQNAIEPDMAPLDALRAYLEAATVAVSRWTEAFARDLAALPAARVMAGLGRLFTRPEVIPTLRSSPKDAADGVLALLLRGLQNGAG